MNTTIGKEPTAGKRMNLVELLCNQKQILDSSRIQLTDEEKVSVLEQALYKKKATYENRQKSEFMSQVRNEATRPWSSKELYNYVTHRAFAKGLAFEIDDNIHPIVKALCKYFSKDPDFEKLNPNWKLSKGLLLVGNIGCGKTTLMKVFNVNQRGCYKMMSCREMADIFSDHGAEVLHTHSRLLHTAKGVDNLFQDKIGICFDDLGTERQGKRYGDSANVMEQIILNRYDHSDAPWYYTHITTNLSADEIESMYGSRVRSRMREMFNMIEVPGEDRRK